MQTRYTVAELGPRLVVGFVAANLSWWGCEQATTVANALTRAVLGTGLDLNSAAVAVRQVLGSATGPLWLLLLGGAVEILLTAAVVAAMIRVGIGAVLVAAAPLALALHALPHTDAAARWWWRLYAGVLATQVGQALVLAVGLRVLTTPSALTASPVSSLLLLTGLLVIMVRIPFALVGLLQPPGLRGPSLVGVASRVYLGYRLLSRVTGTGRSVGVPVAESARRDDRVVGDRRARRAAGGPRPGPRGPNRPLPGGGPGPGGAADVWPERPGNRPDQRPGVIATSRIHSGVSPAGRKRQCGPGRRTAPHAAGGGMSVGRLPDTPRTCTSGCRAACRRGRCSNPPHTLTARPGAHRRRRHRHHARPPPLNRERLRERVASPRPDQHRGCPCPRRGDRSRARRARDRLRE